MLQRAQIDSLLPRGGGDYDVFVAGAGPAGFGAALAASTLGARARLSRRDRCDLPVDAHQPPEEGGRLARRRA